MKEARVHGWEKLRWHFLKHSWYICGISRLVVLFSLSFQSSCMGWKQRLLLQTGIQVDLGIAVYKRCQELFTLWSASRPPARHVLHFHTTHSTSLMISAMVLMQLKAAHATNARTKQMQHLSYNTACPHSLFSVFLYILRNNVAVSVLCWHFLRCNALYLHI